MRQTMRPAEPARLRRLELGYSLDALCAELNCSRPMLIDWEHGRLPKPIHQFMQLAKLYDITPTELYELILSSSEYSRVER